MALKFFKLELVPADDERTYHRTQRVQDRVAGWRTALVPQKSPMRQLWLERDSNKGHSLREATGALKHQPIWDDVHDHLTRALTQKLMDKEVRLVVAVLAALVVVQNWQGAGVAANMTLAEFRAARKEDDKQGRALCIVHTMHHKTTWSHGSAPVTITKEDYQLILKYVTRVNVNLDPTNILPQLLLMPGPVPVTGVSQLLKTLQRQYRVTVPTPTQLRKTGAMAAVESGTIQLGSLVHHMLSLVQTRLAGKYNTHPHPQLPESL